MTIRTHALLLAMLLAPLTSVAGGSHTVPPPTLAGTRPPNILFIIMDDVGIDQMKTFGYGGATPPRTQNIDQVAEAGVRFRNVWAMPECSPSRAALFEGRYPLRTNVLDAILSVDLANSQVSPYETTAPRVLRRAGYQSGLFGKFHLSGSDLNAATNPLGYTAVHQLGWDYFAGWQDGAPHAIDASAGGVAPSGVSYACGFVPNRTDDPVNGADSGACYLVDTSCTQIRKTAQTRTPGRTCLERGGIFAPDVSCVSPRPAMVDFTLENGYYVGQLVVNEPDGSYAVYPPQDPSASGRGYRSVLESQRAIEWIKSRPSDAPWMATISYSAAHTPYQQPPTALLPRDSVQTGGFDCLGSDGDQRVLSNQMIESMDAEIGRVLVQTGLATRTRNGALRFDLDRSNTMIVILGDNGTYGTGVKAPFNPERAKATAYQTGVWVPLIVAGPLVKRPGRQVGAMVNITDVFQLFGEIGGIDVHDVVPPSRPLDSVAMMPYLTNPHQKSIRRTNFTQTAGNIKPVGYVVPPCVVPSLNTCLQLFPTESVCASEGGVWWGSGSTVAGAPQADCCNVNKQRLATGQAAYSVLPNWQMAMRDDDYKLVRFATTDYDTTSDSCTTPVVTEFYAIDDDVPPSLDNADRNLLVAPHVLSRNERRAFVSLITGLERLLASEIPCPGDGNLDGVVDAADIDQFNYWANVTGQHSSWYDFNLDGLTDQVDVPAIVSGEFPRACPKAPTR